jgi:hypothetical protein
LEKLLLIYVCHLPERPEETLPLVFVMLMENNEHDYFNIEIWVIIEMCKA